MNPQMKRYRGWESRRVPSIDTSTSMELGCTTPPGLQMCSPTGKLIKSSY